MKKYIERIENSKDMINKVKFLQKEGLICYDGDFVPSVHYPPITKYPPMTMEELYSSYSLPLDGKLDVYVHFPFCEKHCVFCHYPGKLGPQLEEKKKYLEYLKKEFNIYLNYFEINKITPRSILIGGGTPTYLEPYMLEDFLKFFNSKVEVSKCTQFNYDVDPHSLVYDEGIEKLKILKEYGVTRLTIGVQSFDDDVLKIMNRNHDAKMAEEAIYNTKKYGFDLNIEFIYGHPGENFENWEETIEKAVTMPTDEIQIYRLKVLAYGDRQGNIIYKRKEIPSFEDTMTMKKMAIDILNENGFNENLRRVYTKSKKNISHYAYNQCCNLYDQVGFGITAFSSYRNRFGLNTQYFEEYYKKIEEGTLPLNRGYIRDKEQQIRWSIVLPLKNMDIKKDRFKKINEISFEEVFKEKVKRLKEYDLLYEDEKLVKLTELGSFVADEVVEQFNSKEFIPFPRENYANGPLNPYTDNEAIDASLEKSYSFLFHNLSLSQKLLDDKFKFNDLSKSDIKELLLSNGELQENLFKRARRIRDEVFQKEVQIRGVIEISNSCVKNCDYCAMRSENKFIERYALNEIEILSIAREMINLGIPTVFLQSGENFNCDNILYDVIPKIKNELYGNVLLCVGEKSKEVYEKYKKLGASSYILKFETSNPDLFNKITHSSFEKRLHCINLLKSLGFKVGTGNITGIPYQTEEDLVEDILLGCRLNPDFISTSPFIANNGTPLESFRNGDINLTLNTIAIWRFALLNALIPSVSALEYVHPMGQAMGFNAGANVITVNYTPKDVQSKYAIYAKNRFVVSLNHAKKTCERAGLKLNINEMRKEYVY